MARYPSKQEKTIIIREINPEAFTSLLDYLLNTDMLRCQCDELHTIWSRRPARMEQGPTKEELIELANNHGVSMQDIGILTSTVLARWGRPAVDATNEEWFANFSKWLAREMPEGTVICDPGWWAPRIAAELLTIAADLKEVEPVPVSEWHEDIGNVLWWRFPIEEPPYVGSPLDTDWPGYHTHFTLLPVPQEAKQ